MRPPAGTTAAELFAKWLPDAFAAAGHRGLADAPVVRVTLSGPGGGDWRVRAGADGLDVGPVPPGTRGAGDAEVWVRQPVADFTATFDGDPDLPELLPPGWSLLDLLFLDPRDTALARQIDGRILVELSGKRRRRWTLDLAFGKSGVAAGRARATVRIDAATFEGLRTRAIAPMQALLQGGVKTEGDRSLAMQALLLTASRLSR
jgi:hypothetical protein